MPSVQYFQILCFVGILYPLHSYNLNILYVKGRSDLFLKLEVVKKILLIIVIAITFHFGIIGLIWGQLINSSLAFFINSHYTGKFLNYNSWEQVKDILPIIFLAFIAGSILFIIDLQFKELQFKNIYRLVIGGASGTLAYYILAILFKVDSLQELKKIIVRK